MTEGNSQPTPHEPIEFPMRPEMQPATDVP